MAIGTKELLPAELDAMEDERLLEELKKSKEELFNLRFQSATSQLESHGRLKAVKRDIARIYTILRERELGVRNRHVDQEAHDGHDRAPRLSQDASRVCDVRQDGQDHHRRDRGPR